MSNFFNKIKEVFEILLASIVILEIGNILFLIFLKKPILVGFYYYHFFVIFILIFLIIVLNIIKIIIKRYKIICKIKYYTEKCFKKYNYDILFAIDPFYLNVTKKGGYNIFVVIENNFMELSYFKNLSNTEKILEKKRILYKNSSQFKGDLNTWILEVKNEKIW